MGIILCVLPLANDELWPSSFATAIQALSCAGFKAFFFCLEGGCGQDWLPFSETNATFERLKEENLVMPLLLLPPLLLLLPLLRVMGPSTPSILPLFFLLLLVFSS